MKQKRAWKEWTGIQYYFLFLHNLLSFLLFVWWIWVDQSFSKQGWDLFIEIFTKTILTMIAGRLLAYTLIWGISKGIKKNIPNIYQLNFRSKFNNISFIYLFATGLMSLIYAYGIDTFLLNELFDGFSWTNYLFVYAILKLGTYLISWIFLKITA